MQPKRPTWLVPPGAILAPDNGPAVVGGLRDPRQLRHPLLRGFFFRTIGGQVIEPIDDQGEAVAAAVAEVKSYVERAAEKLKSDLSVEFESRFVALEEAAPKFRGVYREGEGYRKHQLVVCSGSLW